MVWRALADAGHELHIALTGMHMAPHATQPQPLPMTAVLHRCGADIGGHADASAAAAIGAIASDCGKLYSAIDPHVVLVLGDRLDMAPAALATALFNIPLAHIHGGEVTEGAVDDRLRHAVTMLAGLHLVSSQGAADRVARMRGSSDNIVITGAPGLDTLLSAPQLDRASFLDATGLDQIEGAKHAFHLVTVHPETASSDPVAPLRAVLGALDAYPTATLITAPNNDPGGAEMKRILAEWAASRPWVRSVDTLGSRLYPNALRHAAVMIGNSSSGIIEAGLFGLPVVDVGDRQKGREQGANVLKADTTMASVTAAIMAALKLARTPDCRYGDGNAARKIAIALGATYGGAGQAR